MGRARRLGAATWRRIRHDQLGDLAAMLTYYAVFAIFPFALFVVSMTLLVLPRSTLTDGIELAARTMPPQAAGLVREHLHRLVDATSGGFAAIGAALALFGASRGALALSRALNAMHGWKETRGFWRLQATAVLVTLAVSLLVLVALALLVVGPFVGSWIADRLGAGGTFAAVWSAGRWIGAALLVMLVWDVMMGFLPNSPRRFRWVTLGAVAGTLLWLGASRLFALYVESFGRYEKTYGALGAVIVALTWLWLTNFALLFASEVDESVEQIRREDAAAAHPLQRPVIAKEGVLEREHIGDLAKKIGDDLQLLARDHVELARRELTSGLRAGMIDGVAVLMGGVVVLIGFAMLCVTAVVALAPLIAALWLRLVLMSAVYMVLGIAIAALFARKLRRALPPKLDRTKVQAQVTAHALKEQVQHG